MRPFSLQLHYHRNQSLFKLIHMQALPPAFLPMRTLPPYSTPTSPYWEMQCCLSLSWSGRDREPGTIPASSFHQKHSFRHDHQRETFHSPTRQSERDLNWPNVAPHKKCSVLVVMLGVSLSPGTFLNEVSSLV